MKVVTIGEIMLRLMPENYNRFVQADCFEATYAGGEANVAVSLANYGVDAYFVSKVPAHEIGQCSVNALRKFGVQTKYVLRGGDRLGLSYVEKGASQRASKVIYDRACSAFSLSSYDEYDWAQIFEGADWFHFTGITPALSENAARLTEEACKAAKEKNVKISCDLNYRNKLWSKQKAREVMTKLMPYVNVCISNEEDAYDVFGIKADHSDVTGGVLNKEDYISVASKLQKAFGFDYIAITLRSSISANDNNWAGMLYHNKESYFSKEYSIHIVDRVGGGDSFGGGLIYALLNGYDNLKAINFAVAASCLKHSIHGDFNLVNTSEIEKLADGDGSGRVQR